MKKRDNFGDHTDIPSTDEISNILLRKKIKNKKGNKKNLPEKKNENKKNMSKKEKPTKNITKKIKPIPKIKKYKLDNKKNHIKIFIIIGCILIVIGILSYFTIINFDIVKNGFVSTSVFFLNIINTSNSDLNEINFSSVKINKLNIDLLNENIELETKITNELASKCNDEKYILETNIKKDEQAKCEIEIDDLNNKIDDWSEKYNNCNDDLDECEDNNE